MVPQKCDGPCQRTLMVWDVTTVWCRFGDDLGEAHLCRDCLPRERFEVDKEMSLDFKRKKTPEEKAKTATRLQELEADTLVKMRQAVFAAKRFDPGFTKPEPGSEVRYDKRKAEHPWLKHTAWWFVHNCVAHVLIGILPLKPFFQFHDWTSRKMHGK
jgi:hypothetical protein